MTEFACFDSRPEAFRPDRMAASAKGASAQEDTDEEPLAGLEGSREHSKDDFVGVTISSRASPLRPSIFSQ